MREQLFLSRCKMQLLYIHRKYYIVLYFNMRLPCDHNLETLSCTSCLHVQKAQNIVLNM